MCLVSVVLGFVDHTMCVCSVINPKQQVYSGIICFISVSTNNDTPW